jgi:hypothetical protein
MAPVQGVTRLLWVAFPLGVMASDARHRQRSADRHSRRLVMRAVPATMERFRSPPEPRFVCVPHSTWQNLIGRTVP